MKHVHEVLPKKRKKRQKIVDISVTLDTGDVMSLGFDRCIKKILRQ